MAEMTFSFAAQMTWIYIGLSLKNGESDCTNAECDGKLRWDTGEDFDYSELKPMLAGVDVKVNTDLDINQFFKSSWFYSH